MGIVATAKKATKEFFEISEDESVQDGSKKVALTAARRAVYLALDYWAAFLCAALVGVLNYWQWSFWSIVGATWLFDFVIASVFLVVSEKSGQDITLGHSFRRATDAIHADSKLAGYVALIYLNVKAVIWDGPEQVVIYFKRELGGMSAMTAMLVGLTLFQGLFWAWVYSLGYDSVSELIANKI